MRNVCLVYFMENDLFPDEIRGGENHKFSRKKEKKTMWCVYGNGLWNVFTAFVSLCIVLRNIKIYYRFKMNYHVKKHLNSRELYYVRCTNQFYVDWMF